MRHILWIAGLFAGMSLLAQAQPSVPASQTPAASAAPTASGLAAIERQEIRAQLLPRRYTTIASEIGAKIVALPVAEGARFGAGQTLVSFDCSLQRAQLQKAQAELDGAEQTFTANQKLAELNVVGLLDLELSRAAVGKAKADVVGNQALISKCVVAAPFAGRIAEQKAREQQYVQPGQALLDIIDDSVLELEFLVPSRWLTWIRGGTRFSVVIDETGKTYPARFTRIGARVDPVSQSIKVAASIDGSYAELLAGMSGRISITPPANR
jgi:RND family efflux transporter MFP subunit